MRTEFIFADPDSDLARERRAEALVYQFTEPVDRLKEAFLKSLMEDYE